MIKTGDIIELRDNRMMIAPVGARAKVVEGEVGTGFIQVRWLERETHGQGHGCYRPERFIKVEEA